MRNIDLIREVTSSAVNRWPDVLSMVGIDVPGNPRAQVPCPACGGRDRFRFDDNGRGSHYCNQCGAGDGLDLIQKVNNCDSAEAAKLVADVLGIDYRTAKITHNTTTKSAAQLATERQQREQTRHQQEATEQAQKRQRFNQRYTVLNSEAVLGESEYLTSRGLTGFTFPMLADGRLLLSLVDESGATVAAQTITPNGVKRLLTDSTKKAAFHVVQNAPEQPQVLIIAEGLATSLTTHLIRPDALVVVAIDAGNLLPVAQALRVSNPDAQIIIAADNDIKPDEANTGKEQAEKAALSVRGWVSLPPTDHKADWDDYRQQNGIEATTRAFNDSLYQPQAKEMIAAQGATEDGKITSRGG